MGFLNWKIVLKQIRQKFILKIAQLLLHKHRTQSNVKRLRRRAEMPGNACQNRENREIKEKHLVREKDWQYVEANCTASSLYQGTVVRKTMTTLSFI